MNIRLKIFLFIFVFSAGNFIVSAQVQNNQKDILIFFSQAPNTPAYKVILDGIRQSLDSEFGDSYTLYMEFLELEKFPDGFPAESFQLYNAKYRNVKLDLLICIGMKVMGTIKQFADNHISELPAISLDFDFSNYGHFYDLKLNGRTAVIPLQFNLDKTIATALSLFPSRSSIIFIIGSGRFDKFMGALLEEVSKKINNRKNVSFIKDLSMEETLKLVRQLPPNSIIFIGSFNVDNKKVPYYNNESTRLIRRESKVPVITLSNTGIGDGAIGGYVIDFKKAGSLTGKAVVRILNGVDPASITASEGDYYNYIYDWRELKHFDRLHTTLIPKGSIILFEEVSFFGKYKWIIGTGILFLILQTVMIIALIRLNANQKISAKKLLETENKYRHFLHVDRSLRLGQLAASLSHELSQPLTTILSNAQAGIRFIESKEGNEDLLKNILNKIVESDKRGASILSSIRGMMKLESREKKKIILNNLITDSAAIYKREALQTYTQINISIPEEPIFVNADGIQIQQVLLNLIFNASQAMKYNRRYEKIIDISAAVKNDEVIVSVSDRGTGIDEKIKNSLFNPFVSSKKEGTGMGLTICRTIIQDHQGEIWAENMPDKGAKFSFKLNIYKDE